MCAVAFTVSPPLAVAPFDALYVWLQCVEVWTAIEAALLWDFGFVVVSLAVAVSVAVSGDETAENAVSRTAHTHTAALWNVDVNDRMPQSRFVCLSFETFSAVFAVRSRVFCHSLCRLPGPIRGRPHR